MNTPQWTPVPALGVRSGQGRSGHCSHGASAVVEEPMVDEKANKCYGGHKWNPVLVRKGLPEEMIFEL